MSTALNGGAPADVGGMASLSNISRQYEIHLALIVLIAISALISPAFLSSGNLRNMLLQAAPLGIVVIGQSFVLLVRGLDLFVASVMATSAVVATSFSGRNEDALTICVVAIEMGCSRACQCVADCEAKRCHRFWRLWRR